jgi:hypothetical protein
MPVIYNQVFNAGCRGVVSKAVPRNLFTNYQGAMIANGEAWFCADGKVFAINQP